MNKRLILYLTEKCNRHCPKCYVHQRSNKTMTKDTADKIIEYYSRHIETYPEVVFIGGETMLALDMVKYFYDRISKLNPNLIYDFMTNGTISFSKLEDMVDVSRFALNLSFDSINDPDNELKLENLKYGLTHCYETSCLLVNTPDKIEENIKLIKMLIPYEPPVIKVLRQHKASDFWSIDDVEHYKSVLPELMHLSLYYEFKHKDKHKWIILPDKINMGYDNIMYPVNNFAPNAMPSSPVCQDSINYCIVVGIDGKQYLCDGAYGENSHCLGYIWDEPKNIYQKEFGYQDYLYNYCYLAEKTTLPELDQLNHEYRIKYQELRNKIFMLRNMEAQ